MKSNLVLAVLVCANTNSTELARADETNKFEQIVIAIIDGTKREVIFAFFILFTCFFWAFL